ncbi:hypothetical protein Glove_13g9 [Diversispora epigaea]|uniref:Uncharacterized protein n=1 Tax=Diversispora epigaea TaxID=1348612 RepID=A0A397JUB6_9GLOM|nr:hypothetical protein Glove_13g9 [Diversispora epigaea]
MKSQSIYASLLLCIFTFTRILTIAAELCIDYPNPLDTSEKVLVECPPTANTDAKVKRETTNYFLVTHDCSASADLCNKIKEAFDDAGKELTKTLNIQPIFNECLKKKDGNENEKKFPFTSKFFPHFKVSLLIQILKMKSQSIYASLLLCIFTFTRILTIAAELCIDYPNPLDTSEKVLVECPPTANTDAKVKRETTNYFLVTHDCSASADLCNKIKEAFDDAGKELTKTLKLKQIININATLTSLDPDTLGSASSARYIPLTSDDKVIRRYPQALVKQFSFDPHPEYNAYDINAQFNSDFDWWFRSDNALINMIFTMLYYMNLYMNSDSRQYSLTPTINYNDTNGLFTGFTERIFDRYVKFVTNSVVSTSTSYTYQLNQAVANGTTFDSYSDFVAEVKSSSQWKYAQYALISASTNYSLLFSPAKDTIWDYDFYLESGIPYQRGSSVSHVSTIYEYSSDFLMVYQLGPGVTLEEMTIQGNYTSPIGPRILSVLESIGYETDTHPDPIKPTYKY